MESFFGESSAWVRIVDVDVVVDSVYNKQPQRRVFLGRMEISELLRTRSLSAMRILPTTIIATLISLVETSVELRITAETAA
jgi:hypothetical protein